MPINRKLLVSDSGKLLVDDQGKPADKDCCCSCPDGFGLVCDSVSFSSGKRGWSTCYGSPPKFYRARSVTIATDLYGWGDDPPDGENVCWTTASWGESIGDSGVGETICNEPSCEARLSDSANIASGVSGTSKQTGVETDGTLILGPSNDLEWTPANACDFCGNFGGLGQTFCHYSENFAGPTVSRGEDFISYFCSYDAGGVPDDEVPYVDIEMTFSDEFTTEQLIADALSNIPEYPDTWDGSCGAVRNLSADESSYGIQRFKYKFIFPATLPSLKISWTERFTPDAGTPTETDKSWSGSGTANADDPSLKESAVFALLEPASNGSITIVNIRAGGDRCAPALACACEAIAASRTKCGWHGWAGDGLTKFYKRLEFTQMENDSSSFSGCDPCSASGSANFTLTMDPDSCCKTAEACSGSSSRSCTPDDGAPSTNWTVHTVFCNETCNPAVDGAGTGVAGYIDVFQPGILCAHCLNYSELITYTDTTKEFSGSGDTCAFSSTASVSDEFSTDDLIAATLAALPAYSGHFEGPGSCLANRNLSDDESSYTIQRLKYKFTFDRTSKYLKIWWAERFLPENGDPGVFTEKSWTHDAGTAVEESDTYEILEPDTDGTTHIVNIRWSTSPDCTPAVLDCDPSGICNYDSGCENL